MFLTTHASVGLVIGKYIPQPLLAFWLAFLSHLILDMIPHEPIEYSNWQANEKKKITIYFLFDFLTMLTLLFILNYKNIIIWNNSTIWALVGSIILDFLWGFYYLGFKIFKPFQIINHWCHSFHSKIKMKWTLWLSQAILISAISIYILQL